MRDRATATFLAVVSALLHRWLPEAPAGPAQTRCHASYCSQVHARTVNGVSERKDVDLEYCDPAGLDEILAEGRQAPDQDLYRCVCALGRCPNTQGWHTWRVSE